MLIIQAVTIACLSLLGLELMFLIINGLLKKRPERIAFIRSFKKGKCAIIYLTAIPLYCIGHLYAGQDFLMAFFNSVSKIIGLVVLKYDASSINALMDANGLFRFTVYFTFVLVGVNAILFTVSLTNQRIWCGVQAFLRAVTGKKRLFLFGNNPENISIYESANGYSKAIVAKLTDKESEQLYLQKVAYISADHGGFLKKCFERIKHARREAILVVNTGSDERNMELCRRIVDHINATCACEKERLFLNVRVYVFGDPRYETIYHDIVLGASGCIHYINKYQKMAIDFIDRYPLTQFMDERQIDLGTSFVREGIEINVLMIGFGKTNRQIFLTSVANNQFLTDGDTGPVLKPVRYHIFDKDAAENNKNLNHSYYRFKHEHGLLDKDAYLPMPSIPAEEIYYRLDVNDRAFYDRIRTVVTRDARDANFVIIGFGSDLENIDMAQKLVEKRQEWGLDNLILFVKVRVWHQEETLLEEPNCFFIANEKDIVYDLEKLVGDRLFHMAKMRNEVYDLEYTITHEPEKLKGPNALRKQYEKSNINWYKKKLPMERDSSLYACLSLRSKLHLMGLDYCDADDPKRDALTEEEYLSVYAGEDRPVVGDHGMMANGKPIISYPLVFRHSRRETMAIHEHQRWNSFMISKGMMPSSIEQIKHERDADGEYTNGKNYPLRRHGNITTFEGLVTFRRILAARDGMSEASCDVIKYDYQLLDDAFWFLGAHGYKIVRK